MIVSPGSTQVSGAMPGKSGFPGVVSAQDGGDFAALLDPQMPPPSTMPGTAAGTLAGRLQLPADPAAAGQPAALAADPGQGQPGVDAAPQDATVDAPLLLKLGKAGVAVSAQLRGAAAAAAGKFGENIRKAARSEPAAAPTDPTSLAMAAQPVTPQPASQPVPDPTLTVGIQAAHPSAHAAIGEKAPAGEDPDGGQAPDQPAVAPLLPNGANPAAVAVQPSAKPPAASNTPPGSDPGKVSEVSRSSADSLASPQMGGPTAAPGSAPADAAVQTATAPQAGASQSAIQAAGRAVAMRINRAIRTGEETLTVELHPAELGHVAVKLAFHGNGVDVQMVLDRPETFQAFTQDRGSLEQQFAQAGIDLGNGGLDLRFGQGGQSGSERGSAMASSSAGTAAAPVESQSILLDGLVNIVA